MFYFPAVPGNPAPERALASSTSPTCSRSSSTRSPTAPPSSPATSARRTASSTSGPTAFGHHLLDAGIGAGDHVAVLAWNRAEWIEAELGIYKARASVINVNYRYVADELRYMLENSDSVAIVFERSFAPMVAEVRGDTPKLRHFVVIDDGDTPAPGRGRHGQGDRRARCHRLRGRPRRRVTRPRLPGLAPPTTSTSSTPAGRPACRRACCGAPRTSSSPRSVAAASVSRRSRLPRSSPDGSRPRRRSTSTS